MRTNRRMKGMALTAMVLAANVGAVVSQTGAVLAEETVTMTSQAAVLPTDNTGYVPMEEVMEMEQSPIDVIVEGNNQFGTELVMMLAKEGKNVFISPYSITSALSLLNHCSETGEQVEELRSFLGYDSLSEEELLAAQADLLEQLRPDYGLDGLTVEEKQELGIGSVEIANAVFVDDDLALIPTDLTKNTLSDVLAAYQAEIASKELSSEETKDEINAWVKEKTHEMIDSLLNEPLSEDTAMLLMNTVYFMGNWTNSFPEEATDEQTFHGANGDTQVSMMHQQDRFGYAETESYQQIMLPYNSGYVMNVYLPKDGVSVEDVSSELYQNALNGQEISYQSKEMILSMPKFEMEYSAQLKDVLMEMGLEKIFDYAVYDRVSEAEMGVSQILHKTALKNDEHGTEAAAVTAIMVETMALMEPETPIEVTIDRPFYFTITHRGTGVNLFEGCIFDLEPEQSGETVSSTEAPTGLR